MPVAAFESSDSASIGQTITFTNVSTNSNNFYWNFGDGEQGFYTGNPTHSYYSPGNYTVTLTATNSTGSDEISRMIGIYHPYWDTSINAIEWTKNLSVTGQTSETLILVDVITATKSITWTQKWLPGHLALNSIEKSPSDDSQVDVSTGIITWTISGETLPVTYYLTRTLIIKPCSWETTTITLDKSTADGLKEDRIIFLDKVLPELALSAKYSPSIEPGDIVTLTLLYSNTGGLESAAVLEVYLPSRANYLTASPLPDDADYTDSTIGWNLGVLAMDQTGKVTITVVMTDTLQPGDMVNISANLYDHSDDKVVTIDAQYQVPVTDWSIFLPLIIRE
jgi:PKD repeat protein